MFIYLYNLFSLYILLKMARNYNNKALLTYLGIAIGLILFAVVLSQILPTSKINNTQ